MQAGSGVEAGPGRRRFWWAVGPVRPPCLRDGSSPACRGADSSAPPPVGTSIPARDCPAAQTRPPSDGGNPDGRRMGVEVLTTAGYLTLDCREIKQRSHSDDEITAESVEYVFRELDTVPGWLEPRNVYTGVQSKSSLHATRSPSTTRRPMLNRRSGIVSASPCLGTGLAPAPGQEERTSPTGRVGRSRTGCVHWWSSWCGRTGARVTGVSRVS
jgi:hypothetical protein